MLFARLCDKAILSIKTKGSTNHTRSPASSMQSIISVPSLHQDARQLPTGPRAITLRKLVSGARGPAFQSTCQSFKSNHQQLSSGKCATNLKWNYGKKSAVFPTPPTHASCWGLVGLQRNRELSTHQLLDNSSVWLERAGTQGTGRALRVCPVFRSISARGSPGLDCHQLIGAMAKSSR